MDLIEISAGGGGIAWRNDLGLLQVGPHSRRRSGPACYAQGGDQPTVTDANLLLGYLDADFFLGGRMKLDFQRARHDQRAGGVAAHGPGGLRLGHSPGGEREHGRGGHCTHHRARTRSAAIHAGGFGRGQAHVAAVARLLGAGRFVLPPAGTLSSVGCLAAPFAFALERTATVRLGALQPEDVIARFGDASASARRPCRQPASPRDTTLARAVDMRMVGQIHDPRGAGRRGRTRSGGAGRTLSPPVRAAFRPHQPRHAAGVCPLASFGADNPLARVATLPRRRW
ncbi:MAG: hydantoinase/oxoprolinase family protein [Caldilineaceae bacterium]